MQTCFRSLVKKVEQTDGLIDTFEILAQLKLRIAKGREGKYIEQCFPESRKDSLWFNAVLATIVEIIVNLI